jgi:phosphoglycolate phosphatase
MKDIALIIFDLDGTLVDSKQDIVNAVNYTLKELGVKEKGSPEISSYIGNGVEDLIRKSINGKVDCCFKDALSTFIEYYKKHSLDNTRLYPDTKETLEYFKDKRKVIVTNRKREFAIDTLKALDIYDYFEDISGGDNLGCIKPSSCPLEEAICKRRVNKDKTIIVGDMDIDILAGKKTGIITCAVTYGIGKKEYILKTEPDYLIDNLLELKNIINL